jgi:phosphoribosylglycinamide formyltransferase-1
MEALIKAAQEPDYPAKIALVISNNPDAAGLKKAENLGVDAVAIDHKKFKTRKSFEQQIDKVLRLKNTELVCNAGFMRILTPWFVNKWAGRQLNIHPSLLPKYKGLHTHARAIEAGDTQHGCTVHFVNEGMDDGEIIDQAIVPVRKEDTPDTLAARVLEQEHILYPKVLRRIANDFLMPGK